MIQETEKEMATAMTSSSPPTNPRVLDRWSETTKDEDLKNLISDWKKFAVTGEYKSSLDCYDNHQAVYIKLKNGYYGS